MDLVLPRDTVKLIGKVELSKRHPGLQLDKYSVGGEQMQQKDALEKVCQTFGDKDLLKLLSQRRKEMWNALSSGAMCFDCVTVGPLTLHLSRASALENAGICLHPLYGFVYLPGSGLKGMARAYAETVWLATQEDKHKAWQEIEDVFGWAPGSDKDKKWKPDGISHRAKDDNAHVGNVVFHDAWPTEWPQLIVDIVNNHHPKYYQAQSDDNKYPPGDWENPNPVYFLAVPAQTTFQFALSLRRPDEARKELLEQAKKWLVGALCHLGAGAKTAAGYGSFQPVNESVPVLSSPSRTRFEATLELVTPAFLAGANQQTEDCDLRSATLRGLLRWWWRTMHAEYVDVATLRRMEAALWGDTKSGGAVRLEVQTLETVKTIPFPGKRIQKDKKDRDVLRPDASFVKKHKLAPPPDYKTTQGLLYLTFGMDEMPAGKPTDRKQRKCILPGAKWRIVLTARNGFYHQPNAKPDQEAKRIPETLILNQAKRSLWLLCRYGGIGSKAHNGFGSFVDIKGCTLDEVKNLAQEFRIACDVREEVQPPPQTSALADMLGPVQISTPWKNYWFVLDQLGFSVQAFAKKHKRSWVKEALGLPRKIGASNEDGAKDRKYSRSFDKQTNQQVVWLGQKHPHLSKGDIKDMRHASPVHYHITSDENGAYGIRAVAFASPILPDKDTSETVLKDLIDHLKKDFADRIESNPAPGQSPATPIAGSSGSSALSSASEVGATSVRVKFLRPHERLEDAFWVQEEGKKRGLLKYGTPQTPLPTEGTDIEVYPTNNNPNSPEYRWDKPPQQARPGRDRGRPGRGGPPRGRR